MIHTRYENGFFCFLTVILLSFCGGSGEAAVAPNGKEGTCGPYYLWYQVSAADFPHPMEYVYLCGVTFEINDVVDDFDFVYFTDTENIRRSHLDSNQDGISDQFFFKEEQNYLEWQPHGGCVRVNLRQCQDNQLNVHCGYAMIRIQPKTSFNSGMAKIPVIVHAMCPPTGSDCSKTYLITHRYSNCETASLEEFTVHIQADSLRVTRDTVIEYEVNVQNVGEKKNSTDVVINIGEGTKGGTLQLIRLNIACPMENSCTLLRATPQQIRIHLADIYPNHLARISYNMTAKRDEIPRKKYSLFKHTVSLSKGGDSDVTISVLGTKPEDIIPTPTPRPERPIPASQ